MATTKRFTVPFANSGDKAPIPTTSQSNGAINYSDGYGPDYSKNLIDDLTARRVEREGQNQLFNVITQNIKYWQENSFPEWFSSPDNGGTPVIYNIGSIVRYTDGLLYESRIPNNTSEPTKDGNWFVATSVTKNEFDNYVLSVETKKDTSTSASNITADILNDGSWHSVIVANNSNKGMTFNSKPLKVLDIYATENSQWTFPTHTTASKSQPKTDVYRSISLNMLSADVTYQFRHHETGDFYEVFVEKIYKHLFLDVGNGTEIAELQDAICFVAQFSLSKAMDPQFLNVDAGTDYYPNKPQITIAVANGTSQMTKPLRTGEHNLNGVEIVNAGRYDNNTDPATCIVEYTGSLGVDDLGFFNLWKSDLGEVHGVTWKYSGEFTTNQQWLMRWARSECRLKNCVIDISGATSAPGVTNIGALYTDRNIDSYGNVIKLPATENGFSFITARDTLVSGFELIGKSDSVGLFEGNVSLENFVQHDLSNRFVKNTGSVDISMSNSSKFNVTQIAPFAGNPSIKLFFASDTQSVNPAFALYVGKSIKLIEQEIIKTDGQAIEGGTFKPKTTYKLSGVTKGGTGLFTHNDGLDLSGDSNVGHWSIFTDGTFYPYNDGALDIGYASKRVETVHAVNPLSSVSDDRYKTPLQDIDVKVTNAIKKLKFYQFKYLDAVSKKGKENARSHFNVSAQDVIKAFESEGLNPFDYALIRRFEWSATPGLYDEHNNLVIPAREAGERFEVVDSEIHALMLWVLIQKL